MKQRLIILITMTYCIFSLSSCSNNKTLNLKNENNEIYELIGYDNFGCSTAGDLLIFRDQNEDYIFVLTEQDIFINSEVNNFNEREQKLFSFIENPKYEKLKYNNMYKLKLDEVEDTSYIKPRRVTTLPTAMETINPNVIYEYYMNEEAFENDEYYPIYFIKDWIVNGKVYNCDQIYADFILKTARIE